jgi:cytochrome c oxidase cbb3-type subunit 4
MSYESVKSISALLGLFIFIGLFGLVLIYAFWPSNKRQFERASRIPLNDEIGKDEEHGR